MTHSTPKTPFFDTNLTRFCTFLTCFCTFLTFLSVFLTPIAPLFAQDQQSSAPYAYAQLEDPRQEAEAKGLMETLRCVTCQSQSIADSDAPIAGDMRHQVRSRIKAGDSPEQIRGWLMARYGNYISYAPEVNALTWPLFAVPVLLMLGALFIWRRRMKAKP